MVDALDRGGERLPSATWRPRSSASSRATGCRARPPAVEVAAAALREHEIEPVYITTGGGSDANVFIPAGLPVVNLANGTERNHQPDESVTARGARDDARRDARRSSRQAALMAAQTTLRRLMERIGGEVVWEGQIATVRVDRFRYDDGEEAEREIVEHPGAVAVVAHDGERLYLVRQPREAVDEQALLELPGRQARRGGREPARHRPARARRGDRQGRPHLAAPDELLHLARLHRRGVPPLHRHRPLRRAAPRPDENERIEIVEVPLAELDDAIRDCRDSKTLVGLLWLRAFLNR